jgi:hypothetical protein
VVRWRRADLARALAERFGVVLAERSCISLDLIGRTPDFGGDRGRGAEP